MRTIQTLDRIIDKIVETKPARLDASRRSRRAVSLNASTPRSDAVSRTEAPADVLQLVPKAENAPCKKAKKKARTADRDGQATTVRLPDVGANRVRRSTAFALAETKKNAESETESRAKTPRRRQIDPTTCERDYSNEEIEFMKALDAYKRSSGRMFPTCSEILEVFKSLGYVKTAEENRATPAVRAAAPRRSTTPTFLNDSEDRFELSDVHAELSFA